MRQTFFDTDLEQKSSIESLWQKDMETVDIVLTTLIFFTGKRIFYLILMYILH